MTSYQNKEIDESNKKILYSTINILPSFETLSIHTGQEAEQIHGSVNVPIHLSSTYKQKGIGQLYSKFDYTRAGNPTVDAFNQCLASLEHGKHGLSFASGCGATTAILSILKLGDHVIANDDLYGGTNRLKNKIFSKFGIKFSLIDMNAENLKNSINENTKMIWIETPTNPTLKIIDIEEITKVAKIHNIITVVDNTFASPYLQSPLLLGTDIVMHSCTKYIGGHSDIVAGAIITNDNELFEKINFNLLSMGACISPFDAYILMRSLKTLKIRVEEATKNAQIIVNYLKNHPKIEKVFYPGLESHPGHLIAKKQMRNFGAMISFTIKGDLSSSKLLLENMKLITLAESLGGVESLIECPALMTHMSVPVEQRIKLGINDTLIRLSVGIETVSDLIKDLENSLSLI